MTYQQNSNFTDHIQPSGVDRKRSYGFKIERKGNPNKDDLGPIEESGTDIELITPIRDIESLVHTTHKHSQLHTENREQWNDNELENDGTTLYDRTVLGLADDVFRIYEIQPDKLGIPNRRLKIIYLKIARKIPNISVLLDYLSSSVHTCRILGYETIADLPSYHTLDKEYYERLPEELGGDLEKLRQAGIQAIYSAVRNGVVPPEAVNQEYGFDELMPRLHERKIPTETRQQATRNFVREMYDQTMSPLTFERDKKKYDMLNYVGLFATSALSDTGLQTAAEVAQWDHDGSQVPKGSGVPKYVERLVETSSNSDTYGLPVINRQFDQVLTKTLELAVDRGFFKQPVSLAVDSFRIEWNGDNAPTVSRPEKAENQVKEEWVFITLGITDRNHRFTLGTRWVNKKSMYPSAVREMLENIPDFVDVSKIQADKELASGDMIEIFRSIVGEDWIVRAPDNGLVKKLHLNTPRGYTGYLENVSWNCNPKPNAIAYPNPDTNDSVIAFTSHELRQEDSLPNDQEISTLDDFTERQKPLPDGLPALNRDFVDAESLSGIGSNKTHAVYLTDRELPERSEAGVHYQYYQRWGIEQTINQIKNDFLPLCNSSKQSMRQYSINMAVVFQNFHTFINRALSPELGLRLNITSSELLKSIQHVAFNPE